MKKRITSHRNHTVRMLRTKRKRLIYLVVVTMGVFLAVGIVQKGVELFPLAKENTKLVVNPFGVSCPSTSSEQYDSWGLNPPDGGAESNPEIVLAMRGWGQTSAELALVQYGYPAGEPPDGKAPQLSTIVKNGVSLTNTYRVHKYDFDARRASPDYEDTYPVSLLGLSSSPGQTVFTPQSGYVLTRNGHTAMLIYASPTAVTLNWVGDDTAIVGYAMHLDGFCVDPNLSALYRQLNSAGRHSMPVLRAGQALGTANGSEVRVAIRDSGNWLDPRSKLDWWQVIDTSAPPPGNIPTDIVPTRVRRKKTPTPTQVPYIQPTSPSGRIVSSTPAIPVSTEAPSFVTVVVSGNPVLITTNPVFPTAEPTSGAVIEPTTIPENRIGVLSENIGMFVRRSYYNVLDFFKTIAP